MLLAQKLSENWNFFNLSETTISRHEYFPKSGHLQLRLVFATSPLYSYTAPRQATCKAMERFVRKRERFEPMTVQEKLGLVAKSVPPNQKVTAENLKPGKHLADWMRIYGISSDPAGWICYGCRPCKRIKHGGNTSNLQAHVKRVHPEYDKIFGRSGGQKSKGSQTAYFEMVLGQGLTFSFGEDPSFESYMRAETGRRDFAAPMSRRTFGRRLSATHARVIGEIRGLIQGQKEKGRKLSVSCDVWSRMRSFFAVMVHIVDDDFERRRAVLDLTYIETGKTSGELAEYLGATLASYGIENSDVEAITTDGAGDVRTMSTKVGLGQRWYYCAAHLFNRSIVRCFGGWRTDPNPGAKSFFEELLAYANVYRHGICKAALDSVQSEYFREHPRVAKNGSKRTAPLRVPKACTTRWTSVYRLLSRLVQLADLLPLAQERATQVWQACRRTATRPMDPPNRDLVNLYHALLGPVNCAIVEMQSGDCSISGYRPRIEAATLEIETLASCMRAGVEAAGSDAGRATIALGDGSAITASVTACKIILQRGG